MLRWWLLVAGDRTDVFRRASILIYSMLQGTPSQVTDNSNPPADVGLLSMTLVRKTLSDSVCHFVYDLSPESRA